jgi:agmatine deiminase
MWVGFPSHAELWQDNLAPAQSEVAALVRALAGPGRERVRVLVTEEGLDAARALLATVPNVELVLGRFGDIWLRDTGPIFTRSDDHSPCAVGFRFNGWGGKYVLEHDDEVAAQLAAHAKTPLVANDFIMEGGSLDHDGEGTILTTRQCLLNPNRNADWNEATAETLLARALGARAVRWLGDGLLNDHTDGHVDNLARFVAPATVVCPVAFGDDDPNALVFEQTARDLAAMTDAQGRALNVLRIPSPGRILNDEGEVVPASHMNFLVANGAVIVPTYEAASGRAAVAALAKVFTQHEVIGLPSNAVLSGGGSFHCISQQEPT